MTISKERYKSYYDKYCDKNKETTTVHSDVIFAYTNGSRMSNRTSQKKTIHSRKFILGFCNGHMFPIHRTTATEELADIDDLVAFKCIKSTKRLIISNHDGVRVSINMEEGSGVSYSIELEHEYPDKSDYEKVLSIEQKLMRRAIQLDCVFEKDLMSFQNTIASVMPKIQMWHCFDDSKDYRWAYKWDGIKTKMIFINHPNDKQQCKVGLWPDASNYSVHNAESTLPKKAFDFIFNACLIAEQLVDRFVILEIIGASFEGEIFTAEPRTNIQMLDYLKSIVSVPDSKLLVDNKPVDVQEFFLPPKPNEYNPNLHDGFIIVQNEIIIKWKVPTIDVKCVGPNKFVVANNKTIDVDSSLIEAVPGVIYEIDHNYQILRTRKDRIAASSTEEHELFVTSIALMNKNLF